MCVCVCVCVCVCACVCAYVCPCLCEGRLHFLSSSSLVFLSRILAVLGRWGSLPTVLRAWSEAGSLCGVSG